ncbi:ABC transporter permease [Haliscomenobacter sp.]|uniref:MlaE family ABC transporter permease n=1 Tax=Haliscomenobacter sp. TaxID=2717303 RepID=UPI0033652232
MNKDLEMLKKNNHTDNHKYVFSKNIDLYFIDVYHAYKFVTRFFREVFIPPFHLRAIIAQSYEIGVKSLPLITVTGFIIGIVFTKQSRPSLENFGAASWLPNLIGIAIIRALGPILTALICAGKVGSSIGAELSSMKVTEQIEAMEVSAINPFKYLAVTRIVAATTMIPLLAAYCIFIGLMGSYFNVHSEETTSSITFFQDAFSSVTFVDLFAALAKATLFGFTIGIIGCYKGFNATKGTHGVGKAANETVVLSMFLVFVEEIIIVQLSNWIRFY